jgi:LemA protein
MIILGAPIVKGALKEYSMNIGSVLLAILVGVAGYLIAIYNKFVSLQSGIDAAWSDIDVQLKRRYNLIPALVDTVKGYKEYEAGTLEKIIEARSASMSAKTPAEKSAAESMLGASLGKLFALAEAYPDLKADTQFLNLQSELSSIEDAIQNSRRYYNAIVRDYNAKLRSFPDILIAQKYHFAPRDYFELDEAEAEAVKKMPEIDLD